MILTRHLSRNSQSLDLVANRAEQGGLTNVVIKSFSFAWDNLDSFSSEVFSFFILNNQRASVGTWVHCPCVQCMIT